MKMTRTASFIERLVAFLIDVILISIITSIFSVVVVNSSNYNKLLHESSKLINQSAEGKIERDTYISRASDVAYDLSRETAGLTIISLAIYISYFMIYQYKKDGQTIGKKIMKLRVVSNDERKLSMNNFAIRSLIINGILVDMMKLSITLLGTKDIYFLSIRILEPINYILLFAIAMFVLIRKDNRGLHDIITNTKVVKEI